MGTWSPTSAHVLGSFVSCVGTEQSAPARDRGARGASTFAVSWERLRFLPAARLSFLRAAGRGHVGLIKPAGRQCPGATGGPGMCEGRGDSLCRRPLCATPWLYNRAAALHLSDSLGPLPAQGALVSTAAWPGRFPLPSHSVSRTLNYLILLDIPPC